MCWSTNTVEEQRLCVVLKVRGKGYSISEAARTHNVSRPTVYKWLKRYQDEGAKGLADLSRRPKKLREAISGEIVMAITGVRNDHEFWGGRKIRAHLKRTRKFRVLPHSRTIDRILKRSGFVKPRRNICRITLPKNELVEPTECNHVWTTDFKGWWLMRNKKRCEPLTIRDGFSRFMLEVVGLPAESFRATKTAFIKVFMKYGLPLYIQSDNGDPFACTRNPWGLTRLSVWWLKLGITPIRIEPGKPYQNGGHERPHKDMAKELESYPAENMKQQQKAFDAWSHDFNYIRPHEALNFRVPGDIYKASPRRYNPDEPEYKYPSKFETRLVSKAGQFMWAGRVIEFSKAFAGETIGIEFTDKRTVRIWFGDYLLGTTDRNFREKIVPAIVIKRDDKFKQKCKKKCKPCVAADL